MWSHSNFKCTGNNTFASILINYIDLVVIIAMCTLVSNKNTTSILRLHILFHDTDWKHAAFHIRYWNVMWGYAVDASHKFMLLLVLDVIL